MKGKTHIKMSARLAVLLLTIAACAVFLATHATTPKPVLYINCVPNAYKTVPTGSYAASVTGLAIGQKFNVTLQIQNFSDLYGWQSGLAWNHNVLNMTGVLIGDTLLPNNIFHVLDPTVTNAFIPTSPVINNIAGTLGYMAQALSGVVPGVNGTGTYLNGYNCMVFKFLVVGYGTSKIGITHQKCINSALSTITLAPVINGTAQTVPAPPPKLSVTISPTSATMDVGQSKTFTASASGGTPPYSYQWYLNGSAVSGATNNSYTFTPSLRGHYNLYCNATDSANARAQSNTATVAVNPTLAVSISPTTATLNVGQSKLFNSTVSGGTGPFSYQWYLNGSVISGATNSSYTFIPSSRGHYNLFLNVTDSVGMKAQSNTATVTVNVAPPVTYVVSFSESGLPSGTSWNVTFNGTKSSSSSSTITFTGVKNGSYSFTVGSVPGYVASPSSGTVTVNGTNASVQITFTVKAALSVTISPTSVTMDVGQSKTFTASASGGTPPYTYQWYQNGTTISGATNSSYTFTPSSRGHYNLYVNVTDNANAKAQSNTATATVNTALSVTISPSSVTLNVSQSQTFTSSVSGGTSPFTYQWYLDGSAVSGATGTSYTYSSTSFGSYTVYLNVTDSASTPVTAQSNSASVKVTSAFSVTISPTSVTLDVGQSQTFSSTVSGGTSPYRYQWYMNGSVISGATSSSYTFTPASRGHYSFYLNVTDNAGLWVKSNVAYITVNNAFSVTISPSSVTIDVSQSQTFTSSISGGTSSYSYQWYLDGSAVSGATSSSWTYSPSSSGLHAVYVKVIDNASTPVTAQSNTASVTVNSAPSITISPISATMDVGQSQQFVSSVSGGTTPYTYQWYLNGTAINGATSSSYNFTPSSRGHYNLYCNATDSAKARAQSNTATATVNSALSVSISPTSVTLDVGQSKLFNSTVSGGTSPYAYKWYLNGSVISGATSGSYTFTPSSHGHYNFFLNVTDSVSMKAQSNTVTATVNSALSVTISPSSVTLDVGQSQTFTSSVSGGTSPFTYQWYLDGSAVSGATGTSYTYSPSSFGSYTVYLNVTDSASTPVTAQSNTASVTVNSAPSIIISPISATMDVGQSQQFVSSVSGGTTPYTYQWYLNGVAVSGATSAAWTFTPSSAGSYTIRVQVTDAVSGTASASVTVTVNSALTVSISPSPVTMDVDQSQTFTSTVTGGTSPLSYQWYLDGVAVSGATSSSWTYTPSAAGSHTVYVKVTDSASTHVNATSNTAGVTVNGLPTVSISPTSATIHVGETVHFTSTALGGTPPYAYQWYLNNTPVSGATSSLWTFTPSSAGSYNVYLNITDSVGVRAKSSITPVTVIPVLTVTISPTSASVTIGYSVTFTSTVSGGLAPYYYQWYLNGTAVLGAKNSTWTFSPTSIGTYNVYLTVTDSTGTTTKSNVAQVTVGINVLHLLLPLFMMATLSATLLLILLAMHPLKKKRKQIK
jgi:hypothetical protein